MKIKFLSALALAAVTFGMASCSSEEVAPVDGESTVTLSVTLPDGLQSRTFGDGTTATSLKMLVYDVNDANKTPLAVFPAGKTVYETDILLSKQVNLQLVNGKTYKVVCWAAGETSPYTFDTSNFTVTANYEGAVTGDEKLDAFYAAQDITVTGNTNETVKLYRPFAQLNIGTDDLAAAKTAGFEAETVTVTVPTYKSLNLLTGAVEAGAPTTVTFAAGALPAGETFPKAGYDYLSMNYIMMSTDKQLVDLEFTVNSTKGETRTLPLTAVPVQRNYRTNIYGSLLTNSVNVNVEIVPAFEEPDYDRVATADLLVATLNAGNSATLSANIDLPIEMQVSIPADKDVVLNLNGKTISSNNADIWNESVSPAIVSMLNLDGGKLTLTGNGKMEAKENDCYTFNVKGDGHLVIENGTYYGNVSVVQVHEGVCEIKGGTFYLKQTYGYKYMLNCIDENYKNGTAKIIVTGGTFVGFNPADCEAEGEHTNFVADGYDVIKTTVDEQEAWKVVKTTEVTSGDVLYSYDGKANVNLAVNSHVTLVNTSFGLGNNSNLFLNEGSIIDADVSGKTGISETYSAGGKVANIYGNGGKIVAPTESTCENVQAIAIRSNRTLNIYGNGTYEGGSGNNANQAILIVYGTANIYGGYFHTGLDKNGKSGQLIYLQCGYTSSWKANCNIYGGVFEMEGDPKYMINCYDTYRSKCTVKIYGGIFVGFNPADNAAEGEHTNFVAKGYKSVQITYNGKVAYQVVKE